MTTNILKEEFGKLISLLARLFSKNGKEDLDDKKSAAQKEILRGVKMIKSDPKSAEQIFCTAYEKAEKRTMFAAELMKNVGQCRIERSKKVGCPLKKYVYFLEAQSFFSIALREYPGDKTKYKEKLVEIIKTYQKEQWG